jgi:hypothetical protein
MSEVMSYTESEYDASEQTDYFVPVENMSVASDVSSVKRRRLLMENYKKMDIGYNKISRMIDVKKKDGKITKEKKSIEIYTTGTTPGTAIRNAMTGVRHNGYRVGSSCEDVFYKVALATGECKSSDSCILFFDNPEQYERCMYTTLDQPSKDAWYVKFNAYQAREYASRKY